jgi:glycosyltransferase 2 family protein
LVTADVAGLNALSENPGHSGRRHLRRLVGMALLLVVAVFVAITLKRNWDAIREDLGLLQPADYLAAALAAGAGLFLLWASWLAILNGLGTRMAHRDSQTIFFAAQLGKFVPGSVWPAVLQTRLGRRNGVPRAVILTCYALWSASLFSVGGAFSVFLLTDSRVQIPLLVLLGCVVAALLLVPIALHDRGLPHLVSWFFARSGREVPELRVESSSARLSVAFSAATWLLFGLHAWFLARPLGASLSDLPLVVGAFALAFVVGVLAVPLPAGAGLREAVLVLTLGAVIGRPSAITVALMSRLIMILVELLLASLTGVPGAIRWARATPDTTQAK